MLFSAENILKHLTHENLSVEVYDCITSTNTLLKERGHKGAPHGLIVAAKEQTAGRGRMGRSFFSPSHTGVYFSLLLRPSLSPSDALLITTAAAVACARVLEQLSNKKAEIKWVNDIYIDGKKVCGILTEASFSHNKIEFAVLGIGVNLTQPEDGFPAEIQNKAGFVFDTTTDDMRSVIVAEIINEFLNIYETIENKAFISEYRSRSMLDGMKIDVIKGDTVTPATALYIDQDLSLVVRYDDGKIEHLSSGDVSIAKQ